MDQQPKILIDKCLRQLIKVQKNDKANYLKTVKNVLTAHEKYVEEHEDPPTHLVFAWYDNPNMDREIVSWRFWNLSDQSDKSAEKKAAKAVEDFFEKAKSYWKDHEPLASGVDMEITLFDFLEAIIVDSYILDVSR